MASEAILKVKESETTASEILKNANERAKEIIKKAEITALEMKKATFLEINIEKADLMDKAVIKAEKDCKPMLEEGKQNINNILNPDDTMFKNALNIVMERIVNVSGNS